jgi:hypothetical protein
VHAALCTLLEGGVTLWLQGIRRARDPIDHIRTLLLEHDFADAKELKQIEKDVKQARPFSAIHSFFLYPANYII